MDSSSKTIGIVIAVVVVLAVCFLIPVDAWTSSISSGRYVSEGTVDSVNTSKGTVTVYLHDAGSSSSTKTGTKVTLKGDVPDGVSEGQSVRIGYSKKGLYEDTSQTVEVAFYVKSNVLMGIIVPMIAPLKVMPDFDIVDVDSDGSLLHYYQAS